MRARNSAARTDHTPSIFGPASDRTFTPFLEGVTIKHGPRPLLGRFFLLADQAARTRGITLEFSSMEELVKINRLNPSSWRPILPHYDAQYIPKMPSALSVATGMARSWPLKPHGSTTGRRLR
jgi:hypothetical protein